MLPTTVMAAIQDAQHTPPTQPHAGRSRSYVDCTTTRCCVSGEHVFANALHDACLFGPWLQALRPAFHSGRQVTYMTWVAGSRAYLQGLLGVAGFA